MFFISFSSSLKAVWLGSVDDVRVVDFAWDGIGDLFEGEDAGRHG